MNINQGAFRKIDRKIYVVFIIVIAIALINAIISTYTIKQSQNITSDIVNNTNPSLDALSKMNLLVTKSRMLITNWVYLPYNSSDKDSLRSLNNSEYTLLRARLFALMANWPNKNQSKEVQKIFFKYDEIIAQQTKIMHQLSNFEDYQDPVKKFAAEEILEQEIIPQTEEVTQALTKVLQQQTTTALAKQDDMLYRFNKLVLLVLGFALLIVGSILFAGMAITRSIILPILQVRGIIMQIGRGELPQLTMKIPRNAVGEMMQALGFLIDGFKQTSQFVEQIGKGNFNHPFQPLSSKDVQGQALLTMRNQLKVASEEEKHRNYQSEGISKLNSIMRSSNDNFNELLEKIIETIVEHIEVEQAAIFLLHNEDMNDLHIQLGAYHALNNKILNSRRYELKEGLVGEAIASNKIIQIENIFNPYFSIDTGMGESKTCNIMIIPLTTNGKMLGAIEVATLVPLTPVRKELLQKMAEPIAASLFNVRSSLITNQLLEESRKQAEELVFQESELRNINIELTKQSELLKQSEEDLKTQQEELKQVNIELQNKAGLLEEQNLAIEDARLSLVFKAEQLEQSNKYKSAFLANMSHELRTPLNSILILAKLLADNKTKNLEDKQIEHARIIHKSGNDLLTLINDILDLSKIEAGKVELQNEDLLLSNVSEDIRLLFRELAADKQINFIVNNETEASQLIFGDKVRIEQIIKNLLSNAFKFTATGGEVEMKISIANPDSLFNEKELLKADKVIAIAVRDSGIGIAPDKQKLVFEAFQQADGSTSRKFGGTGLGLAICRELAHLMGGEIILESTEGVGSTFTLFIPTKSDYQVVLPTITEPTYTNKPEPVAELQNTSAYGLDEIKDDRNDIQEGDQVILIIEDDYIFARMLMNHCHRNGFKSVIALQGDHGLAYASRFNPTSILLDLRLPVLDGWTILKKLKENQNLCKIPVHIISSVDKKQLGLEMGATNYINKPTGPEEMDFIFQKILSFGQIESKQMIFIGERNEEVEKIITLLEAREKQLKIEYAKNLEEAIKQLKSDQYDCMMFGSSKTEMNNHGVINQIQSDVALSSIPMVFYSSNPDECLREVHLAINKNIPFNINEGDFGGNAENDDNKEYESIKNKFDDILKGKMALVVDDDVRNIYSMTSILEGEGVRLVTAFDGLDALEKLKSNPEIEIVLMDIMMPNMNGYEAIAEIRKNEGWKNLPIIAVTAQAMNGDREKSMEAGASDHITKPVNADQLLSLMKVWLYK